MKITPYDLLESTPCTALVMSMCTCSVLVFLPVNFLHLDRSKFLSDCAFFRQLNKLNSKIWFDPSYTIAKMFGLGNSQYLQDASHPESYIVRICNLRKFDIIDQTIWNPEPYL